LLATICADRQEQNKEKWTSQKHPNSFPSSAKGRAGFYRAWILGAPTAFLEVTADL
jgi:hypothetical protein